MRDQRFGIILHDFQVSCRIVLITTGREDISKQEVGTFYKIELRRGRGGLPGVDLFGELLASCFCFLILKEFLPRVVDNDVIIAACSGAILPIVKQPLVL